VIQQARALGEAACQRLPLFDPQGKRNGIQTGRALHVQIPHQHFGAQLFRLHGFCHLARCGEKRHDPLPVIGQEAAPQFVESGIGHLVIRQHVQQISG